jgi:beta-mannosidase
MGRKSIGSLSVVNSLLTQVPRSGRGTFRVCLFPFALSSDAHADSPGQPVRKSDAEVPRPIVVQARLLDTEDNDSVLARYSNWPEPWKYLTFPKDPKLSIKVEGDTVTLTCGKPIKGVILDLEDRAGEEVKWSDQAIDMFPGDTQVVEAKGLKGRKVKARYIGDGSA